MLLKKVILLTLVGTISLPAFAATNGCSLINKINEEIWTKYDLTQVDNFYAANYIGHEDNEQFNLEQLKAYVKQYSEKFTNVSVKVDDCFQQGNKVAARMTYQATNKTTNKQVVSHGVIISHISNGKIAASWLGFEPPLD